MSAPVFILGGYQSDFAKVWSRQGQDLSDMTREATLGALQASAVPASAIQSIHVGNARWCPSCGGCRRCATKGPARPPRWPF
jgi:hypothetical protein